MYIPGWLFDSSDVRLHAARTTEESDWKDVKKESKMKMVKDTSVMLFSEMPNMNGVSSYFVTIIHRTEP